MVQWLEMLAQLSDYLLLKKDSAPWSSDLII
jgi:hypothetical protein